MKTVIYICDVCGLTIPNQDITTIKIVSDNTEHKIEIDTCKSCRIDMHSMVPNYNTNGGLKNRAISSILAMFNKHKGDK